MKVKSLVAALLVCSAPAVFAQDAAAPAPKQVPQSPEAWLSRMTDMTQNMSAYKDPKIFVPFMNAVTEPSFYTTMGNNMMDPGNWLNMANSMTQPGAYANLAAFADPNVYMKWLAATLDPNFYTAMLTQLSDPGKLLRWAMVPADPKALSMILNSLNPNVYVKWLMSPLDPRAMQLLTAPVNPNLYMGWLGASLNPGSYGDTWKSFVNPAYTTTPAVPTAATPWGAGLPSMSTLPNVFDPNALTQMFAPTVQGIQGGFALPFPVPTAPAPLQAPAAPR